MMGMVIGVRLVDLDRTRFTGVPKQPGVYFVCWVRNGKPVPIQRLLSVDENGILYIGSTKAKAGLRGRLRQLWNSVKKAREGKGTGPHTFGPTLVYTSLISRNNRKGIKIDELVVWYKAYDDGRYAEAQEKMAIYEYTNRYGEPPPLNLRVGRRYLAIVGLAEAGKSIPAPKLDPELEKIITGMCSLGIKIFSTEIDA